MRWIKASERLPEKFKGVIVRNIATGKVWNDKNMGHFHGWGVAIGTEVLYDRTEWLDESESGAGMKEACGFADFIKEDYSPVEDNSGWILNGNNYKRGDVPDITVYKTEELYNKFKALSSQQEHWTSEQVKSILEAYRVASVESGYLNPDIWFDEYLKQPT